jgi:Zn finger protein HypA/HybF involved in hydrogenase expression
MTRAFPKIKCWNCGHVNDVPDTETEIHCEECNALIDIDDDDLFYEYDFETGEYYDG